MRRERSLAIGVTVGLLSAFAVSVGCNALTGAGDLSVCQGADCTSSPPAANEAGATPSPTNASSASSSSSSSASSSSGDEVADSGGDSSGSSTSSSTSSSSSSTSSSTSSSSTTGGPTSCVKAETNLLAYYPLDALDANGNVPDCSGNGFNGKMISQGTFTPGKFGNAFTGTTSAGCIDLGAPNALQLEKTSTFTIAAWANTSSFPTGTFSRYIIGRTMDPLGAGWRLGTDPVSEWGAKYHDATNGPDLLSTPDGESTGVWYHVAVSYDANAGSATLYVNGVSIDSDPLTAIAPDTAATLRIGCRGDNIGYFNGSIDELRIYNVALGADQIRGIFNRATP